MSGTKTRKNILFLNFGGAQGCKSFLVTRLKEVFTVNEVSGNPDIVVFNNNFPTNNIAEVRRKWSKAKFVTFTGENVRPRLNICSLAISFDYSNAPNHMRFPLWLIYTGLGKDLIRKETVDMKGKQFFCGFVSRHSVDYRNNFVKKLSGYKQVKCAGAVMNNYSRIGSSHKDKLNFLSKCKFTISYENSNHPGYVTEKIVHPFMARSIPIYWGSVKVGEEFNKKAFLCRHDYKTDEEFIKKIKEIDSNNEKYLAMLNEPPLIGNKFPTYIEENLLSRKIKELLS